MQRRQFLTGLSALAATGVVGAAELRDPDVIYEPTPDSVVDAMLELAGVTSRDVVYDLGCGDGRIVITAARRYGARGVGIDIDPDRVAEATVNVRLAGVADRVRIVQGDLFEVDISPATVVMLFLLTELNLKLRPKLLRELRPGTRIVSHIFGMGTWKPERKVEVDGSTVNLWRVPPRRS